MGTTPTNVLVTGGNRGIGRATVEDILEEGEETRVFMGSRSLERGEEARDEIAAERDDLEEVVSRIEVIEMDVAEDESVERAADEVSEKLGSESLGGLVNNAGIGDRGNPMEEVFEVNVYGPHRVCEAFVSMVERPGGRVVNVSSAAGPKFVAKCDEQYQALLTKSDVRWEEIEALMEACLEFEQKGGDFEEAGLGDGSAYGISKACLNAYTIALARENPELVVNACTPGFIETGMTRPMAEREGKDPEEMGMKPPEEGTTAQMHLLFGEPEGSGWYFGSDAERSPLDRYRAPGDPPYEGD